MRQRLKTYCSLLLLPLSRHTALLRVMATIFWTIFQFLWAPARSHWASNCMKVSQSSLAQPFLFRTWYLTPSVQGSFLRDSSDTSRSQTFQVPWKRRGKDYLFSETNLKGTIIATTYWEPSMPVIHIFSPTLSQHSFRIGIISILHLMRKGTGS